MLDEYGFVLDVSEPALDFYQSVVLPSRQQLEDKWFQYISSVGGSQAIDVADPYFKSLVRSGIPKDHRPMIWGKMTDLFSRIQAKSGLYELMLDRKEVISENTMDAIKLDVPRTFAKATCFTKEQLQNVLTVLAVSHPEIGYCQGMNFLAAVALSVFRDEEQAFHLVNYIIEDYFSCNYFTDTMEDYHIDLCVMTILIDERVPELSKMASRLHHNWIQNTSSWLLTVFSNCLPMGTVLRIWDSFLLEGPKIIFRVSISILRLAQDELLKQTNAISFAKTLSSFQSNIVDQDKLMDEAFAIKVFSKKHLIELRKKAKKLIYERDLGQSAVSSKNWQNFLGIFNM